MEFTEELLVDFLKKLIIFNKDNGSAVGAVTKIMSDREEMAKQEWVNVRNGVQTKANGSASQVEKGSAAYRNEIKTVMTGDISGKESVFSRLQMCVNQLNEVKAVEESIVDQGAYKSHSGGATPAAGISLDDILQKKYNLVSDANEVNKALANPSKKGTAAICASFYGTCRSAEGLLVAEINKLRNDLVKNRDALHGQYNQKGANTINQLSKQWDTVKKGFQDSTKEFKTQRDGIKTKTAQVKEENQQALKQRLTRLEDNFCKQFPPQEFLKEFLRVYAVHPSYENYEYCHDMPQSVHISNIEYDLGALNLNDGTKDFLKRHYYFLLTGNTISIPYSTSFDGKFNYLFQFQEEQSASVVKSATVLAMGLFSKIPPGKAKFTFIDPVKVGESFALFPRLVSVDDRSNEVINGKIWHSPNDIEDKLNIMINHISNVIQRCLQGKFDNIYEYNRVAEQNAEAYQMLMLMDYPAGLSENALKLLEQIVTSGPKCGVFTMLYRNESQYKKVSDRSYPLISNIEANFQKFDYRNESTVVCDFMESVKNQGFRWQEPLQPSQSQLDNMIATLRKGIKTADKVVIDIDKVSDAESTVTTQDGIRIPIGIHGANEVQYLTLGVGGSHHALIAGVAGSGKSSLLHTIILRTLTQYSPEELSVYLVDFKRGVEFKIYSDFQLPTFKVVAIESEREFGYNILLAIEREQKIRADLFKKSHVDKIEEYRELGKKLPRILVIMDEFHELFSSENDEFAKKSATIMERIVRQGRAFGVHMILASQSYSNITGVDRAVFDQMAVRVVLKCSKADANLLLDQGSTEIDQISIDDPGRAVYNSEAGNKEYNSHFRVAYIDPGKHREMLQTISDSTKSFADPKQPTRILLSNIEDNNNCIFNQFTNYTPDSVKNLGDLYIGEPLSVTNNMMMTMNRSEFSNLLMIGGDTEKARSMFAFGVLSLCVNYWIAHRKAPETPFITLFNCKPLEDTYFDDSPQLLAEHLPEYVRYITCGDSAEVKNILTELYENTSGKTPVGDIDKYFFVFGYQRGEELKSETKLSQSQDMNSLFHIMPGNGDQPQLSPKEMFKSIVQDGAEKGVHSVIWQDNFNALYQDDKDIMSYFTMKIAFDLTPEEYTRFVGASDTNLMSENNAIYYNRARDNQKFRPYQAPDSDWLKTVCEKLK